MNAGARDQRIEIQRPPSTVSATGAVTGSWTSFCFLWATVKAMRGGEASPEGVPVASGVYRFEVVKPTSVTVNDRIVWHGRNFNILSIDDSARDVIVITAADGQQREA